MKILVDMNLSPAVASAMSGGNPESDTTVYVS